MADIFFGQEWNDHRLRLPENMTREYQLLPIEWLSRIWRPDSYFKNAKQVICRNLKTIDIEKFMKEVKEKICITETDFGDNMRRYNTVMGELVDMEAPLKNRSIKEVPSAPWFDGEYRELRKQRRKQLFLCTNMFLLPCLLIKLCGKLTLSTTHTRTHDRTNVCLNSLYIKRI